jgi:hypothetical protein
MVTNRQANLHNAIITLLGRGEPFLLAPSALIYAVAYGPSRQSAGDQIEVWPHVLQIGGKLPILPLALRNADTVPVDLEGTYMEACHRSRLI